MQTKIWAESIQIHPGAVLREEFLKSAKISVRSLARGLNTSQATANALVREERNISPEMAMRLAKFFSTTPQFWMNLQTAHDLSKVDRSVLDRVQVLATT